MKVVMFTVPPGPERERFSSALRHATEVIRNIAIEWCCWYGDDFTFDGDEDRYQKLYFWICGYGDCEAVHEQEAMECAGWAKPQKGLGHELADAVRANLRDTNAKT